MMRDHLDGLSFQSIANKYDVGKTTAYRIVVEKLKELPDNNKFSHKYCINYGDVFVADAKYIMVKGHERGMAFLWGVDYVKHDFPLYLLAASENYQAWNKFFFLFRVLNHHYPRVVSDELLNIHMAVEKNFPSARVQICYNHVKENIRRVLKVRSDDTYKEFMGYIENLLSKKRNEEDFNTLLFNLFTHYKDDKIALSIIMSLERKREKLRAYIGYPNCPITTNIIESFNSHLNSRLTSIRGFEGYDHANLWLNGYLLKRRYTKFSSCKGKFKHFNGHFPLESTVNNISEIPDLF